LVGLVLIALLLASCEGYVPSDNSMRRHGGGTSDEDRDRTRDQNR
jgi:hypothetical protein